MNSAAPSFPVIREAVASFPDREHFRQAVRALMAAGFDRSDLSVLASRESVSTVEDEPGELIAAGLSEEIKYLAPMTIAGIIVLSAGPVAALIAAAVGAGIGGVALKELIDDYTAAPHRDEFAAALQAGSALLWVRCSDPEVELRATRVLEEAGGRHVHIHGHTGGSSEAPPAIV